MMRPDGSQPVEIREAAAADLDVVTEMRLAFLADLRGVEPETFTGAFVEQTRAFMQRAYAGGARHSWIAVSDGGCAGVTTVLLQEAPPRPEELRVCEGYIVNMYVVPAWRGQGVGRAFLGECLASAQRLAIRRFYLHATDGARAMYEAAGFAANDTCRVF